MRLQLNIIHNIDRGWRQEIFPFLLLQTVNLPLSNLILNCGGQIKYIYLLYCYGVGGKVTGQTTTELCSFPHSRYGWNFADTDN